MAQESKRLSFILNMVDKMTGPAVKASSSLTNMGKKVTDTQAQLDRLTKRGNDINAMKGLQESLASAGKTSADFSTKAAKLSEALAAARKASNAARSDLTKAERAMEKMKSTTGVTAKAMADQQAKVDKLRAAHAKASKESTLHKDKLKDLTNQSKAHESAANKQREALSQVDLKLKQAGVDTKDLTGAYDANKRKMDTVNGSLRTHQSELTKATQQQNKLTEAKARYNKTMELSQKVAGYGMKATVAGGAMMGGIYGAGSPFTSFDKAMSGVQATGRMSGDQKAQISEVVEALAESSIFTANDGAGAAQFLAQANFSQEQIEKSLGPIMSLAAATNSDLMQTADIASNIMGAFKLEADEMGRVSDVLTMAANSFNVDLSMLGESMKYLAPVAQTLGMSMETAAAMTGLLGNVGIQGSSAGNALKSMAGSMAAPTSKKAQDTITKLGIKTKDEDGNALDMPYILKQLKDKTAGMGNADMTAMMKTLFGAEFYGPVMEMISQADGKLEESIKVLEESKGAAAEAEAIRLDNLAGDFTKLTSMFGSIQNKIGRAMDGIYRSVVQSITGVLGWVNEWMKRNPILVKTLGMVGMAIGAVMSSAGVLLLALAPVILMWAKMQALAWALPTALKFLSTSFYAVTGAIRSMAVAAATNPLVWLAAAAVAAGYLIYKHWDKVSAFFSGFWEGMKMGLAPLVQLWDQLVAAVAPLSPVFDAIGNALSPVLQWFKELLNPVAAGEEQLKGITSTGVLFGQAFGLAISAVTMPIRIMIELIGGAVSIIGELWGKVMGFLSNDPVGVVSAMWGALPEWFSGLGASILEGLNAAWELILALIGLDPMQSIGDAWAGVGAFFSNLGDQILGSIGNAIDGALGKLKELGSWFGNALGLDIFGSEPELKEQVNEAPAKGSGDTAKVNDKPLTKGNQVKAAPPVVKYETHAPVQIQITAAPGMTVEDLGAEFDRRMADYDRKVEQRNRSRVNDY